jgi:hypothetical protein
MGKVFKSNLSGIFLILVSGSLISAPSDLVSKKMETFSWSVEDPDKGETHFLAIGNPGAIQIEGKGKGPTGKLSGESSKDSPEIILKGAFEVNPSDIDTGIDLRNYHMREKYLEIKKYPLILFKLEPLKIPEQIILKEGEINLDFTGFLKIHGVQKTIKGKVFLKGTPEGDLSVNAKFSSFIADYGIEVPSFMGITVAKRVDVEVNFKAIKGKI